MLDRLTPALRSEDFFETFCGLAADGKANKEIATILSIGAMVTWIIVDHDLWEKRDGPFGPERARLYNTVTVITAPIVATTTAVDRTTNCQAKKMKYDSQRLPTR